MNRQLLQRAGLTLALIWTLTLLAEPAVAQAPGAVRAWGRNDYGQLGNGTHNVSDTPVTVAGLSGVVAVAAGSIHSLAVKSDGTVWAWGNNSTGQLGNGSHTDTSSPVAAFFGNAVSVAAGFRHSLALKSNGAVWAWGLNDYGQLGNISINTGPYGESTTPVAVSLYGVVTAIAAGSDHNLALMSDGTVWAWGNNSCGQLGDGTNLGRNYPVQVLGLSDIVAVAAGSCHSLALKSDGEVWTWGYNGYGQLGNSTYTDSNTPVAAWLLPKAVAIAGGLLHSVAMKDDGTIWNWGMGYIDLFNNGHKTNIPVQVSGLSGAVSVAAGGMYQPNTLSDSMALKSDGTVWRWQALAPSSLQQIGGLAGAVKIVRGSGHNLAVINPVVGISPTSVNFGTIITGSSSATQNVTITNLGSDPLVVASLSIGGANSGDFSVTGPPLPITVPMYSSTTAAVRFTPAAAGARSGTLIFGDNGFQGPHTVSLTGTGATPADVSVKQSVVQSGSRLTYTITVRNSGPGSAATVTLNDTIPAQTQFVSIAGSGCLPPGKYELGCNIVTLSAGMQTTVTLVVDVTATQPTQLSNAATVSSATPDPSSGNNSSTLKTSWTGTK